MSQGKKVHSTGHLGLLIQQGQVKKLSEQDEKKQAIFETADGIKFSEGELIALDTSECEPWKYANRHKDDMGAIAALKESIKSNQQMQPGLVRPHTEPHGKVRYEIIFGRRRHAVCAELGLPFLVICKDIKDTKDAIVFQDTENRARDDVSHYSNALLYKRLLKDKIFSSQKELAMHLGISESRVNDILSYTKIPSIIVDAIPNIHEISNALALKIVSLLKQDKANHEKIMSISDKIGNEHKTPVQLQNALQSVNKTRKKNTSAKIFVSQNGQKLFTFRIDHNGAPCIVVNKDLANKINIDDACDAFRNILEKQC